MRISPRVILKVEVTAEKTKPAAASTAAVAGPVASTSSSSPVVTPTRTRATAEQILAYSGYRLGKTLGDGAYAKVKEAWSTKHNKYVAVKIVNRRLAPEDFRDRFLPRELEIIRRIRHPSLIRIYALLNHEEKVCIVMEKATYGDLLENIKKHGHFDEESSKKLFRQLADGVMYLHNKNIVHRDLKCENILMVEHGVLKIGDFGFARGVSDTTLSDTFCGSAAYAPPEILQGIPYRPKRAEIWSLGVILYIMLVGMMPYDDSNVKAMIKTQLNCKLGFPDKRNLSTQAKNLIYWMLERDVNKRATPEGILDSDWMTPAVNERQTAPPRAS